MRRKDREMDKDFAFDVIDKSTYGVISMIDQNNEPYGLPLSMVRYNDNLYFHSAMEGRKVNVLKENSIVSVTFVGEVKVPENFTSEELEEISKDESKAVVLISSVFTTEYESVVIKGRVRLVEDKLEKIKAMKLICEKYTPDKMNYFDKAIGVGLKRTSVYKIEMNEIKAKRKKYDINGKEMKWSRME